MQPAPQPPQRPTVWADQQLAALRERLPGWEPWHVATPFNPASHHIWCARPAGAAIATCHGATPGELAEAVAEFEADLAAHIETTREQLKQTPGREAGRRDVLQRQLAAMTRLLSGSSRAAPARDAPP
jgi:hypothetical protein